MVVIIAAATNSRSNKLDVPGKPLPNLDNQKNTALGAGIARHAFLNGSFAYTRMTFWPDTDTTLADP